MLSKLLIFLPSVRSKGRKTLNTNQHIALGSHPDLSKAVE